MFIEFPSDSSAVSIESELMSEFEHWMTEAMKQAEQAAGLEEVPVGAVVVIAGELVGKGYNRTISKSDPTAHAELEALRDAARQLGNHRLAGSTVFVTVEPCTMCAGALVHARVQRLVFGAREPRSGAVCSTAEVLANPNLNHTIEVIEGVCATECGELMSAFFRDRR